MRASQKAKTTNPSPAKLPGSSGGKYQVLVVDDHPIVRHGLSKLLNQDPKLNVCAEAEDYDSALKAFEKTRPDIAVIDISLKGRDGIDLIKTIRSEDKEVRILVLSMHDETLYAERALRAGASGYMRKQKANRFLMEAIHKVLGGEIYVSENMGARMLQQFVGGEPVVSGTPVSRLTDREMEVFQLLGQGKASTQIAAELGLSVKTVEAHRAHIRRKLHVETGNELIIYAIRWFESEGAGGKSK